MGGRGVGGRGGTGGGGCRGPVGGRGDRARGDELGHGLHVGRQEAVGAGTVDFAAIFAAARGSIRHAFIEHDQPADPWAFAETSLAAYRRLEG